MQAFFVTLVFSLFTAVGLNAQNQYEDEMIKAFELWQDQKPKEAADLFERIATTWEEKWLPYYYASYLKIEESFPMSNVAKKKELLKDAQHLLNNAKARNGDNVELMILQAMLHTATLTLDPAAFGMKLAPVISGIYDEASKKAPENPRLVLSKAEWDIGSATYFGEDPKKYCPQLKAGIELFAKENHSPTAAPAWGEER